MVPKVDTKMVSMSHETLFNKEVQFPHLFHSTITIKTHPYIGKNLLTFARYVPELPLAGTLKQFLENGKLFKNDKKILSFAEEHQIPFHNVPQQESISVHPKLSKQKKALAEKAFCKMLNKVTIAKTQKGNLFANLLLSAGKMGSACDKFEKSEKVYIISTFQDVKIALPQKCFEELKITDAS